MTRLPSNFTWVFVSLVMTGLLIALCYVPPSSASHPSSNSKQASTKQTSKQNTLPTSEQSRFGDFGGAPPHKTGNVANLKQTSGHGGPPAATVNTLGNKSLKKAPTKAPQPSKTEPRQHDGDFGGG